MDSFEVNKLLGALLGTVFVVLSLGIFIASAIAWGAARGYQWQAAYITAAGRSAEIGTGPNQVTLTCSNDGRWLFQLLEKPAHGWHFRAPAWGASETYRLKPPIPPRSRNTDGTLEGFSSTLTMRAQWQPPAHRLLGFGWAYFEFDPKPLLISESQLIRTYSLHVPYWFLLLASGILPAKSGWHWRQRRRRMRNGLCLACGYDLRSTPDRCPSAGRRRYNRRRETGGDETLLDRVARAGGCDVGPGDPQHDGGRRAVRSHGSAIR